MGMPFWSKPVIVSVMGEYLPPEELHRANEQQASVPPNAMGPLCISLTKDGGGDRRHWRDVPRESG